MKNSGTVIVIIISLILAAILCSALDLSPSHEHKSAYSQLSPQEQENARWAYEAKQAIDDYNG